MEKLILRRVDRNNEEMVLNFGPQHPSTHGVINFIVETDGEVMKRAIPDVGYLHRSIEKIGEVVGYPGFMPFTDRIDYVAAMFANEGYAIAVEKLLKVEVPPRAQWLRAISGELVRIASHLVAVGTMTMDIGAFTPMVHGLREREEINDYIEALCGSRLTYNYHRIGGVAFDLPEGWRDKVLAFLDRFDRFLPEFDRLITYNEIYKKRLANVAVIRGEQAISTAWSARTCAAPAWTGTSAATCRTARTRASSSTVPVGKGWAGTVGDCFDRYYVRCLEMKESSSIVRQALETIPEGEASWRRCRATSSRRRARRSSPRRVRPRRDGVLRGLGRHRTRRTASAPAPAPSRRWGSSRTSRAASWSPTSSPSSSSLDVVAPEIDR